MLQITNHSSVLHTCTLPVQAPVAGVSSETSALSPVSSPALSISKLNPPSTIQGDISLTPYASIHLGMVYQGCLRLFHSIPSTSTLNLDHSVWCAAQRQQKDQQVTWPKMSPLKHPSNKLRHCKALKRETSDNLSIPCDPSHTQV